MMAAGIFIVNAKGGLSVEAAAVRNLSRFGLTGLTDPGNKAMIFLLVEISILVYPRSIAKRYPWAGP